MNYLDLLPVDVMKIINRKVHDLQIKHRKIERIENKMKMMLQKQIANRKRYIYEKYVKLYKNYIKNQKWEYCCDLVAMMKKEFGKDHLNYMVFLEDDEPYIISTILHEGRKYNIKVSK
jgi:hypothetical protein